MGRYLICMIEDGFEYAKMTMTMKVMRVRVTMTMMMMMMRMAPPGRQIWSRLMEVFAAMQPGSDPFTPPVDHRHTHSHGRGGCGSPIPVGRHYSDME